MITLVSDIMIKSLVTVTCEEGLCRASNLMYENNIGCLPVLEKGELVGILTSRDIRNSHPNRIVADAMSSPVISIASTASLWEAANKVELNGVERLLVVDDMKLKGLVTKKQLLVEIGKQIDALTGLYRRDYIYDRATRLLEDGSGIAIIFIDLNNFGYIDKELGHMVGDMVLKEFSSLLESNIPDGNCICRYGGDEFIVLTQYMGEECRVFAENLLKIVEGHIFLKEVNVTAAAGIACIPGVKGKKTNTSDVVSELINLASLASTKAKKEKLGLAVAEKTMVSEIA